MLHHATVTIDCADAAESAAFWSAALDRPIANGANRYFAQLPGGPGRLAWLFVAVPEPKTVKNRVHVDFTSPDRDAEVARLVGLGATELARHDEYGMSWTTLRDPHGNEFCVADEGGH